MRKSRPNSQSVKREQPRKDSKSKRVNFDNERLSKYDKDSDKDPKNMKQTHASNDVAWYANNPELLKSAASFPFAVTTGQPTPFGPTPVGSNLSYNSIPGVYGLYWTPSLGGDYNDAVNQAARSTYSFVVHANSRSSIKYSDQDLMLIILAAAQVFSMLAHGVRMYGVMKTFDQRNDYLPRGLVQAMGFNYDDCREHLAQIWFDLNEMIARTQQIWIPNTFPIIQRWFWLNSNIYIDADSVKGQFYLFAPANMGMYDETYNSQGGALNFSLPTVRPDTGVADLIWQVPEAVYSWANYKAIVNNAISVLVDSEDRGTMMGDILKAYGVEKIFAMQPIPVDYRVQPVYDREVLTQIENAVVCETKPGAFQQNQTTMRIETNWPSVSTTKYDNFLPDVQVLNFHQLENPTPEQVMVATRLKPIGNVISVDSGGKFQSVHPAVTGTEYICRAAYVINTGNPALNQARESTILTPAIPYYKDDASGGVYYGNFMYLWVWNAFDWAPWLYIWDGDITPPKGGTTVMSDATTPKVIQAMGDYDNHTYLQLNDLLKMHTCAVYSEFGVPTI